MEQLKSQIFAPFFFVTLFITLAAQFQAAAFSSGANPFKITGGQGYEAAEPGWQCGLNSSL